MEWVTLTGYRYWDGVTVDDVDDDDDDTTPDVMSVTEVDLPSEG